MVLMEAANALCDAWSTGFETMLAEAGIAVRQYSSFHRRAGRMGRVL